MSSQLAICVRISKFHNIYHDLIPFASLMELQVFTVLMVNKFSFEPDAEVKFAPTQFSIFPALEGRYEEGMKIPLKVTALE